MAIRGRCVSVDSPLLRIRSESGLAELRFQGEASFQVGDLVEVDDAGSVRVLTPNRAPGRSARWMSRVLDPRRLRGIESRLAVESAIRAFFAERGFRETRTPLLVASPGMEPHIRPFQAMPLASSPGRRTTFLPTSPEFAMKKLLAGGLERIFQLCPAFRDEPDSLEHRPEFTMLEWYRAYAGYEDLMRDTEELLAFVAAKVRGSSRVSFRGRELSVEPPWPRLRVRDLFEEHAGVDLVACASRESLARECARLGLQAPASSSWDDLYFLIWLNRIEPELPADRAIFVTRYPESQAALSVVDADADGSRWARRFEAYAGGLELGNAFEELTDPVEQRRRFEKDMELRAAVYGAEFPRSPIDEEFLSALEEGMPPSAGIAMGVDRLVMLMADEGDIGFTFWPA